MKARPRMAERKAAALLSEFFISHGASRVFRQPVLGRTGPDFDINEFEFIVDIKSRLEVPEGWISPKLISDGTLIAMPLGTLEMVSHPASEVRPSKLVNRYYEHMDAWTKVHQPSGLTAIILHKPGLRFVKAMFVIHIKDKERLEKLCQITL